MKSVRLIICGFGRVGRAFAELVCRKCEKLARDYDLRLCVTAVVDVGGAAVCTAGLDVPGLLAHVRGGGAVEGFGPFGRPGLASREVLSAGIGDVLVETTPTNIVDGEPGLTHLRTALSHGLSVATASKGPLVLRFRELQALARAHGARLMLSAATAAALPTLDVGLTCLAGAEVLKAEGILNGTTNYILTRMDLDGATYAQALAEAQHLGIAEPDPSLDVEGRDTANKVLLIANCVFGASLTLADISVRGIAEVTPADLAAARAQGKTVKLIGRIERAEGGVVASVAPEAIPLDHPLGGVRGTEKALTYLTDTMGAVTISGGKSNPVGAAAALLKDLINLSR
jgi:homoserine dehydrogenase